MSRIWAIVRQKSTYYGIHGHLLITFSGLITACTVTAATGDEREALWELTQIFQGVVLGDKGYLGTWLQAELARVGINLQTPLRANRVDSRPPGVVRQLTRVRRLVETVIGPLTAQFHFEKIWARYVGHLTHRITRKLLAHTVGVFINRQIGRSTLQLQALIA